MPKASALSSACPFCGYDLAGLSRGQCPECGRPVYRFTQRARELMRAANNIAIEGLKEVGKRWKWWTPMSRHHLRIRPVHLLQALVTGPQGVGLHVIRQSGASLDSIHLGCVRRHPRVLPLPIPSDARLAPHSQLRAVVAAAINAAVELGHDWVGTEHLLLGLIDRGDWRTRRLLSKCGIRRVEICRLIQENLERVRAEPAAPDT